MPNVLAKDSATRSRVISTGNSEIDKKMGGGIPVGSLTLLEGQSDAGKSVLAQQMIWGSLNDERKSVLYTTENTVKSFVSQMESLSLDITDHLILGNLKVYPVPVARGGWSAEAVFEGILRDIERYEDPSLVVVDSLTGFVTHSSEDHAISFFEACRALCGKSMTIIAVVHSYAFNDSTLIRVRSMCDAHLRLRIEELGNQLVKSLEVAKVRGADRTTGNIVAFDVEPGIGMRIIPITKAKPESTEGGRRVSVLKRQEGAPVLLG